MEPVGEAQRNLDGFCQGQKFCEKKQRWVSGWGTWAARGLSEEGHWSRGLQAAVQEAVWLSTAEERGSGRTGLGVCGYLWTNMAGTKEARRKVEDEAGWSRQGPQSPLKDFGFISG